MKILLKNSKNKKKKVSSFLSPPFFILARRPFSPAGRWPFSFPRPARPPPLTFLGRPSSARQLPPRLLHSSVADHPAPPVSAFPFIPLSPRQSTASRNRSAPTFRVVGASSPRPCLYKRKPGPSPHPLLLFPAPSRVAMPERTAAPRSPSSADRPSARTASSEPPPSPFPPW